MSINSAGLISWTPSNPQIGNNNVVVSVTDSVTAPVTQSFTIVVAPAGVLSVTASGSPINGVVPFSVAFNAIVSGGAAPYTYSWDFETDGTPDSTVQNPSNTYTASAVYTATVTVTDAVSTSVTDSVTITATTTGGPGAPTFTTTSCSDGEEDESYTCDVDATGTGVITYSLVTAPSGMTINTGSGLISWTPTNDGSFSFTVRAIDLSNLVSTDKSYSIDIEENTDVDDDNLFVESISFKNYEFFRGDEITALVTLENEGDSDFDDLELSMSIEELGLYASLADFDLDDGEKKTKEISLQLPTEIARGYYLVKFKIENDDVRVVKYRDIFVNAEGPIGNAITQETVELVSQPSITGYLPENKGPRTNWLGVFFLLVIVGVLVGIVVQLVRRLSVEKQNINEVTFTELDSGLN